jgi:hypothetical protein
VAQYLDIDPARRAPTGWLATRFHGRKPSSGQNRAASTSIPHSRALADHVPALAGVSQLPLSAATTTSDSPPVDTSLVQQAADSVA